jgi:hypothetical protein
VNEENRFALVRKPPFGVERAEPGVKRILTGMVTDTLALAKKRPRAKPVFTVLNGGGDLVNEVFRILIESELAEQFDLRFIPFKTESELINLAENQPFDLVCLYLWGVFGGLRVNRAVHVLARLKLQYGKPIIVEQGMDLTDQFKQIGVSFLVAPFSVEHFRRVLQVCLNAARDTTRLEENAPQPRRTRPPRIVMMNSELGPLQSWEIIIRDSYKDAVSGQHHSLAGVVTKRPRSFNHGNLVL